MQLARRGGPKAAAAAAAAVVAAISSSDESAECFSARQATEIHPDEFQAAENMIMREVVLSNSQDGTAWLDCPGVSILSESCESFVNILDLAREVAEDSDVQRVIFEKVTCRERLSEPRETLACSNDLSIQPKDGSSVASIESFELESGSPKEGQSKYVGKPSAQHNEDDQSDDSLFNSMLDRPSLASSWSSSTSSTREPQAAMPIDLPAAYEALRKENGELRKSLLQAQSSMVSTEHEQSVPHEQLQEDIDSEVLGAAPLVRLSLQVTAAGFVRVALEKGRCDQDAAHASPDQETSPPLDGRGDKPRSAASRLPQQAIMVAAILVGVVAFMISRNPKGAKQAAQHAAVTIAALVGAVRGAR